MSLVLVRVDDRLIHGQVVEGWLRVIQAKRILVVSDKISKDPFQISLMALAVPTEIKVNVLGVKQAAQALKDKRWEEDRLLVLTPRIEELYRLVQEEAPIESVNLGGIHDGEGRIMITPSLSLNEDEKEKIKDLIDKEISFETRALPNDKLHDIKDYL